MDFRCGDPKDIIECQWGSKHGVMLVMCIQRGWQRLETPVPGTQLPPSTIVHSRNENKNSIVFPVRPSEEIIEKVIVANQGCP